MNRSDSALADIVQKLKDHVTHTGHKPLMLIVDDSKEDLILCERDIREMELDMRLDMVTSGQAAFEKLTTGRYDFALIDLNMPGMNGFQLMDKLLKAGVKIPLMVMSGLENGPLVKEAIERGAMVHVRKSHFREDFGRLISWLKPK
jgi:CheY-like chemotaxis protein